MEELPLTFFLKGFSYFHSSQPCRGGSTLTKAAKGTELCCVLDSLQMHEGKKAPKTLSLHSYQFCCKCRLYGAVWNTQVSEDTAEFVCNPRKQGWKRLLCYLVHLLAVVLKSFLGK